MYRPERRNSWKRGANGDVLDPALRYALLSAKLKADYDLLMDWIIYDDGTAMNRHEIDCALADLIEDAMAAAPDAVARPIGLD